MVSAQTHLPQSEHGSPETDAEQWAYERFGLDSGAETPIDRAVLR